MLREIGVRSIDDLFAPIPPDSRVSGDLNIPRQMAESEIFDYFRQRSAETSSESVKYRSWIRRSWDTTSRS